MLPHLKTAGGRKENSPEEHRASWGEDGKQVIEVLTTPNTCPPHPVALINVSFVFDLS